MKRIITLIVAVVLVLGMTQCRKKALEPSSNSTEMITVTVTAGLGGGNSKTGITSEGKVTWNVGDMIYYGKDASNISSTTVTAVGQNTQGVEGKVATFTVNVEKNTKYHFYYCGSNNPTTEAGRIIKFDEQNTPSGSTDLEYIANNYHIIYGTATIGSSGVTTIGMNNIMSIGKFDLSKAGDKTFTNGEDIVMFGLPNAIQLTFEDDIFKVGSMVTYEDNTQSSKGTVSYFEEGAKGKVFLRGAGGNSTKYVALVPASNNGGTNSMRLYFGGIGTNSVSASNTKGYVEMSSDVTYNQLYTNSGSSAYNLVKPDKSPFSISEAETVYFAPGNLYYNSTATPTSKWYFEKNQYDYRTYFNGKKSNVSYKPAVIDGIYNENGTPDGCWGLFGWSTDAIDNNWGMHTQTSSSSRQISGNFKDWGENAINFEGTLPSSQTANESSGWFTLSREQWSYLLGKRESYKEKSGCATINFDCGSVYGLVILPDTWNMPTGVSFNSKSISKQCGFDSKGILQTIQGMQYGDNIYSTVEWGNMAAAGAVFLPAVGYRDGEIIGDMNSTTQHTYYWTSSHNTKSDARIVYFYNNNLSNNAKCSRCKGSSVRLVHY